MPHFFVLLVLLAAFPPLSTDMYLLAIPALQRIWGCPLLVVNLTLIGFFSAYCLFLLVYGPLSDRFGRRRPLLVGLAVYIVASLGCAAAGSVYWMIGLRLLQGAGGAAASALSLAMTKDLYDGLQRVRIMAHLAVVIALAPMLAPLIGGAVMVWFNWRWIFVLLAGWGLVCFIWVCRMPETFAGTAAGGKAVLLDGYRRLLQNFRFIGLALATSSFALPAFAFIAGSSDIYINRFGLTPQQFSGFFAFNAAALMIGPLVFNRLSDNFSPEALMAAGFGCVLGGGVWMAAAPATGPWHLALPNWVIAFGLGLCRPPANNLALEQVDQDAGAASALLIFIFMLIGAGGMGLISMNWHDKVKVLGWMAVAAGTISLGFWLSFKNRFAPLPH